VRVSTIHRVISLGGGGSSSLPQRRLWVPARVLKSIDDLKRYPQELHTRDLAMSIAVMQYTEAIFPILLIGSPLGRLIARISTLYGGNLGY